MSGSLGARSSIWNLQWYQAAGRTDHLDSFTRAAAEEPRQLGMQPKFKAHLLEPIRGPSGKCILGGGPNLAGSTGGSFN
jgi:hypothetical protein